MEGRRREGGKLEGNFQNSFKISSPLLLSFHFPDLNGALVIYKHELLFLNHLNHQFIIFMLHYHAIQLGQVFHYIDDVKLPHVKI